MPLSADDRVEVARMLELWEAHGFPDPGDCGRDAEIVWPASTEDVLQWCKRYAPCAETAAPCTDACQTSRRSGFGPFGSRVTLLVVAHTLPRESFRHELGHLWQRCAGMPRRDDDPFKAWLEDVEGRK